MHLEEHDYIDTLIGTVEFFSTLATQFPSLGKSNPSGVRWRHGASDGTKPAPGLEHVWVRQHVLKAQNASKRNRADSRSFRAREDPEGTQGA